MENLRSPCEHRNNEITAAEGGGNNNIRELVRTRGGLLEVPRNWFGKPACGAMSRVAAAGADQRKPGKLLLNVSLQDSFGPVQVVMLPENTVHDLKKAVVEVYVSEKRRPFLECTDPRCFVLHYSQFSLEGLKPEEKLMNLGSRNFFLCQKLGAGNIRKTSGILEMQANAVDNPPFLMDLLL